MRKTSIAVLLAAITFASSTIAADGTGKGSSANGTGKGTSANR